MCSSPVWQAGICLRASKELAFDRNARTGFFARDKTSTAAWLKRRVTQNLCVLHSSELSSVIRRAVAAALLGWLVEAGPVLRVDVDEGVLLHTFGPEPATQKRRMSRAKKEAGAGGSYTSAKQVRAYPTPKRFSQKAAASGSKLSTRSSALPARPRPRVATSALAKSHSARFSPWRYL